MNRPKKKFHHPQRYWGVRRTDHKPKVSDFSSLPKRARKALEFMGFTTREEVCQAILKGVLWSKLKTLRNFGRESFHDIVVWGGVSEVEIEKPPKSERKKKFAHFAR